MIEGRERGQMAGDGYWGSGQGVQERGSKQGAACTLYLGGIWR